jgi:4-hydroxy-tetrahydrodipicolinate synthase
MAMGGIGCISVLSNVLPAETRQICNLWFEGKVAEAAALQMKYKPLIDALFSEVNPIPVKAALAAMGLCSDYARLPLTSMEDATRQNLLKQMREVGIEV